MAVREIVLYPDPILKTVTTPVTTFDKKLNTLLTDMIDTMYANPAAGLAAPQVGELARVTVVDVSRRHNELLEFVNPEIIARAGKTSGEEGCLSIPEFRDTVERAEQITVRALDRKGETFEMQADGFLAICLQHEIDHLNGVLFIDRLSRLKRSLFLKWYRKHYPEGT
jgi:peptide deformylase